MVIMNTGEVDTDLKGLSFSPEVIGQGELAKSYDLDTLKGLGFTLTGKSYVLESQSATASK
jgi:hypothetical protein